MLARWTLHAQPAPPFIQHSFEQRLQLFYQVFSFENNPWARLGRILRCLRNDRKTLMSTKACYCGKVSPIGKPVDYITILWRQPWEELVPWEPTPWQNSGHHDCSKKAVYSLHNCQTAILPHVGTLNSTCWALHLSISIHLSNSFSCSMKFFLGWPWANLALLAQRQKNTDVHKGTFSARLTNCNVGPCWHVELSTLGPPACWRCFRNGRKTQMSNVYFFQFPWEGFPRQTCNNHLRQKQGCKLIDQI